MARLVLMSFKGHFLFCFSRQGCKPGTHYVAQIGFSPLEMLSSLHRWSLLVSTLILQTFGANGTQENSKTYSNVNLKQDTGYLAISPVSPLLSAVTAANPHPLSSILVLAPSSPAYKCITSKRLLNQDSGTKFFWLHDPRSFYHTRSLGIKNFST